MAYWLVILIGISGGIAVGFQATIAGIMGQKVGGSASSFIIHLSGLLFSGIYLLSRKGEQIQNWQTLPWYMLMAGIFGLMLYLSLNITIPRLGGTLAITLIVAGQLMIGFVIDHYGLFGVAVRHIDLTRLAGILVVIFGAYLISK